MLIGLLLLMQAQAVAPVKTIGPPVSANPSEDEVVQGTGDAVVLGAIGAVDANVIEAAKLAATKATSSDVKAFANLMLREHQQCLTLGADLAKKFNIARLLPPDSVMARVHEEKMTEMSLLTGAAFDRMYMQFMLDDHKAITAKINTSLRSQAVRLEVKTYVAEWLPKLVAHQDTAAKWLAAHPK